jgi:hypothetical protein
MRKPGPYSALPRMSLPKGSAKDLIQHTHLWEIILKVQLL